MPQPHQYTTSASSRLARPTLAGREWFWVITLVIGATVVLFSPLREYLKQIHDVQSALDQMGAAPEAIFVLGAILITALGFPRMLVYPIGGLMFGFWQGLTLSVVALLAGGYLPFCYARWGGRGFIIRTWPKMAQLADYFHDRSYRTVVLLRITPMPGFLTNAFLGITGIKHRSFLLGTLLGSIPPGIPATLLASGLADSNPVVQWFSAIGATILFAILWFVLPFYLRNHPNMAELLAVLGNRSESEADNE